MFHRQSAGFDNLRFLLAMIDNMYVSRQLCYKFLHRDAIRASTINHLASYLATTPTSLSALSLLEREVHQVGNLTRKRIQACKCNATESYIAGVSSPAKCMAV